MVDADTAVAYAWGVLCLYASDLPDLEDSEVFLDAPTREAGAEAVFAALAHDAAHLLAARRDITDTSRNGTYHNLKFATLAMELGFITSVRADTRFGWATLHLNYPQIDKPHHRALAKLVSVFGRGPEDLTPPVPLCLTRRITRPGRAGEAAVCACEPPTTIRIAYSVFSRRPIRCEVCGTRFRLKESR